MEAESIYTHTYTHTAVHAHTHTHIHAHTHAHAHTQTHTLQILPPLPLITVPLPAVPALPPLSHHSSPSLLLSGPHLVGIVGARDEPHLRHELQQMTKKRKGEVWRHSTNYSVNYGVRNHSVNHYK